MPGAHHNAMPHGHQCTPLPQTRGQSSELCRVRRMLRPGRRPGGRGQGPLSRDVPRTGVARPLGATPMEESPGTCRPTRRGDQRSGGASWLCRLPTPTCPPRVPHPPEWCGEARRLGEQRIGTVVPWSLHGCGRAGHRLVSWVVWASQCLAEDAWGWGQVAGQGLLEWSRLGPEFPLGQWRAVRRLLFPVGARLEHASTG